MRPEVSALVQLGTLPDEVADSDPDRLGEQSRLLQELSTSSLTADETAALCLLFPADGHTAFGLAWSLLHIIESGKSWPQWELLESVQPDWAETIAIRLRNAGLTPPT